MGTQDTCDLSRPRTWEEQHSRTASPPSGAPAGELYNGLLPLLLLRISCSSVMTRVSCLVSSPPKLSSPTSLRSRATAPTKVSLSRSTRLAVSWAPCSSSTSVTGLVDEGPSTSVLLSWLLV